MPEGLPEKNRFGRWMEAMNTICNTSYAQVARHIGITRGALSQSIYGNGGVKSETAIAILEMYRTLAQQQNIPLSITWDKFFLLSWFRGGKVVNQADEALQHIEYVARIKRERDTLHKQVEVIKKNNLAQDLLEALAEIEQLKGEIARLKRDTEDS